MPDIGSFDLSGTIDGPRKAWGSASFLFLFKVCGCIRATFHESVMYMSMSSLNSGFVFLFFFYRIFLRFYFSKLSPDFFPNLFSQLFTGIRKRIISMKISMRTIPMEGLLSYVRSFHSTLIVSIPRTLLTGNEPNPEPDSQLNPSMSKLNPNMSKLNPNMKFH